MIRECDIPEKLKPFVFEIEGKKYLIRIRKLTPKECFRLMGFASGKTVGEFDDTDFEKAAEVNSNTQLYKQAGNSIVKQVLMAIFNEMFPKEDKLDWLKSVMGVIE